MSLPTSDFHFPPLIYPLTGFELDEIDFAAEAKRNVEVTNEQRQKMQATINYFSAYSENKIVDKNGYGHLVLSKPLNNEPEDVDDLCPFEITGFIGESSSFTWEVATGSYLIDKEDANDPKVVAGLAEQESTDKQYVWLKIEHNADHTNPTVTLESGDAKPDPWFDDSSPSGDIEHRYVGSIEGNADEPNGVLIEQFLCENVTIHGDGEGGTSVHPWQVSVFEGEATIVEGKVYDGLKSITEVGVTVSTHAVGDGDVVCLEYTYSGGAIATVVVSAGVYEPFTDDGADPPVLLTTLQPLAIIGAEGSVTQMARNNFQLTSACINGQILKQFTAI